MIDLRFGVTVKPRSQIEVNSGNKTCVGDVVANVSVFFAVADGSGEDSSVARSGSPAELVSEGECLVDGHGPSVLGDSTDNRHPLFSRVDTELLTFNCRDRDDSPPKIVLLLFGNLSCGVYLITEDCWNGFIKIPHPETATCFNVNLIYRHPVHGTCSGAGASVAGFITVRS